MAARDSGSRRLYVRSLPVVLVVISSVNLTISTWLQPQGAPIRLHDEGSLTHLVHVEQRTTDRRYGFYLELGDVASGQILRVPEDSPIVAWMTRGLSDVELQVTEYDPTALPTVAIPDSEPLGVIAAPEGEIPYWILPGAGSRWMAHYRDGIVIVPESVAQFPGRES